MRCPAERLKQRPRFSDSGPDAVPLPRSKAQRMSWAQLLKRVFNIDIEVCPKCAGPMKIIAAIEDPKVIKKILDHLELPSIAPRFAPARGPPQSDQADFFEPLPQEFFEN